LPNHFLTFHESNLAEGILELFISYRSVRTMTVLHLWRC